MADIREPDSPIHPHEHKLVRSMGLLDVVMIGIAGMIGGSIFLLTGPAIGLAGSSVILAFILNAIITLFTAMGYAELGSAMPEAGGGYLWVREGLRRPNAFISGWMAWLLFIPDLKHLMFLLYYRVLSWEQWLMLFLLKI